MESKNIFVLFLYHEANIELCVFVLYVVVKCNFIVAIYKFEQPSCLIAWAKNYTLMNAPVYGE